MANDATKNTLDVALYDEEYQVLRQQLLDLQNEKFNEVELFVADAANHDSTDNTIDGVFKIWTTEQGSAGEGTAAEAPSVTFEGVHLGTAAGGGGILQNVVLTAHEAGTGSLTTLTMDNILALQICKTWLVRAQRMVRCSHVWDMHMIMHQSQSQIWRLPAVESSM